MLLVNVLDFAFVKGGRLFGVEGEVDSSSPLNNFFILLNTVEREATEDCFCNVGRLGGEVVVLFSRGVEGSSSSSVFGVNIGLSSSTSSLAGIEFMHEYFYSFDAMLKRNE